MWSEKYESLSLYDKGDFRELCNYLLSKTYVVREIFLHDKQQQGYNEKYRKISQLFEIMREYFEYSGWKLEKDDNYGVISLISADKNNHLRVDKFTTLFLYVCRLIYEEEREKSDNRKIVRTDTGSIIEKMRLYGLLEKGKSTHKARQQAQRTLAHFNIIQKIETTEWHPDGNGVLILPSILSIISNQGINALLDELEELRVEEKSTKTDLKEGDEA